jgi:hypothetical protein
VIDVDRYKYVWASHQSIRCGKWVIHIPYGLTSDGASGVPDRVPAAFWSHDRLYLSPWADYKGKRTRVKKRRADMIFSALGRKAGNLIVWLEGLVLATGINRMVWCRYRKREESMLILLRTVPRAMCWEFPTQFTCDACWLG